MSDGGAGALVQVVGGLAKHPYGRGVLLVSLAYFGLISAGDPRSRSGFFVVAAVILLICGAYALVARLRARGKSGAKRAGLLLIGFLLLVVVAVIFGVFMLLRRKKATPESIPDVSQLEALAQEEARQAA